MTEAIEKKIFTYNLNVQSELLATMRAVARHYYGALGTFAYDAYEFINNTYYGGDLPVPMIQVGITGYGGCMGLTKPSNDDQPKIKLHPSTISPSASPSVTPTQRSVFGYSQNQLGVVFAYETLLHELVHVAVCYKIGEGKGDSSHNNEGWISEVNRISPLIGLPNVDAQLTKVQRVEVPGELTKTGRPQTKPAKVTKGNVTLDHISRWPHPLRLSGDANYYAKAALPFVPSDPIIDIKRAAARAQG